MNKKIHKEDVWKIISEHVGKENAINQDGITLQCYLRRNYEMSNGEIRRLIRALRE